MDVDHELLDLLNNLCNVYTIKETKKKRVLGCFQKYFYMQMDKLNVYLTQVGTQLNYNQIAITGSDRVTA